MLNLWHASMNFKSMKEPLFNVSKVTLGSLDCKRVQSSTSSLAQVSIFTGGLRFNFSEMAQVILIYLGKTPVIAYVCPRDPHFSLSEVQVRRLRMIKNVIK